MNDLASVLGLHPFRTALFLGMGWSTGENVGRLLYRLVRATFRKP